MKHRPNSFGKMLRRLLDDQQLTVTELSLQAGVSHSLVSLVMSGKRTPPTEGIDLWADALFLTGSERDQFLQAARSQRAKGKEDSADYVCELEDRVRLLEQSLLAASSVLRRVIGLAQERGFKIPADAIEIVDRLEKRINVRRKVSDPG